MAEEARRSTTIRETRPQKQLPTFLDDASGRNADKEYVERGKGGTFFLFVFIFIIH